jgi:tRNA(Ser,Leu) C12 N-acetylase TAN1
MFHPYVLHMANVLPYEVIKLIVTSQGLEPARYLRSALRRAVPGARVRSSGFRGVFTLEGEGDPSELAQRVYDECSEKVGHVTAVLAIVKTDEELIRDAAARIGAAQIGSQESFCFRVHKRGLHGLEKDSATLEAEIGGAIWTVLEKKFNAKPKVRLKNPDVTVTAEILGPVAAVGITCKSWRESP